MQILKLLEMKNCDFNSLTGQIKYLYIFDKKIFIPLKKQMIAERIKKELKNNF